MGRHRVTVALLVLLAALGIIGTIVIASRLCPAGVPGQACPAAAANRAIVIALGSIAVALLVIPFAFLAEFLARRRIVYRGAWWRAIRHGVLAGIAVAAVAGLRLGGALSVPVVIFVIVAAAAVEWFMIRNVDLP